MAFLNITILYFIFFFLSTWGVIIFYFFTANKLIRRPEEALDIQPELIFINGMVHLLQEWNFGTPTTLPSPVTPPSPLTVTPEVIFPLKWRHTFNVPTTAMCIERYRASV